MPDVRGVRAMKQPPGFRYESIDLRVTARCKACNEAFVASYQSGGLPREATETDECAARTNAMALAGIRKLCRCGKSSKEPLPLP